MATCMPSPVSILRITYVVMCWLKLYQLMKRKCRDGVSERTRYEKRIQRSIDTLLRVHFGLPIDPKLSDPQPCSTVEVKAFLWEVAQQIDPPTEGYEPNALEH